MEWPREQQRRAPEGVVLPSLSPFSSPSGPVMGLSLSGLPFPSSFLTGSSVRCGDRQTPALEQNLFQRQAKCLSL